MKKLLILVVLFQGFLFGSTASSQTTTYYAAPYSSSMNSITYPSVGSLISNWWTGYQAYYWWINIPPNNCHFTTQYFDPTTTPGGYVATVTLGGDSCGGGGAIYPTAYSYNPGKTLGAACKSCEGGVPDKGVGNPIDTSTGNKFQTETDYTGSGLLQFVRYYNSSPAAPSYLLGPHWTNTYARQVEYQLSTTALPSAAVVLRPDGRSTTFHMISGAWQADADVIAKLTQLNDTNGLLLGWEYQERDGREIEDYDARGRLIGISRTDGQSVVLIYNNGVTQNNANDFLPTSVTAQDGRSLKLTFDSSQRLSQLTDPAGAVYAYAYDSSNRLQSVTYPGGTTKSYNYDESTYRGTVSLPMALTSIVDEKTQVFAIFKYADDGRAISTEHAGGVQKYTTAYNTDGSTSVTTPDGAQQQRTFVTLLGAPKLSAISTTADGVVHTSSYTYDSNGHADVVTDKTGRTTDYDFNSRGLLAQEIDSANTAATKRTTSTTWHANFNVPTERLIYDSSVTQPGTPKAREQWTYNSRGQELTHVFVGANNPNSLRTTGYVYCEQADVTAGTCPVVGLLTRINGPRTSLADDPLFAYYPSDDSTCGSSPTTCSHRKGDLFTVTNAKSQVTTYLVYDGAGRPLQVSDINGVITDFTYSSRGWLTQVAVRGINNASTSDDAITTIAYEATGTVSKITEPDGNYLSYTYDTAHRLTDVTDSLARTIHYTLNNAGNPTKEDIKNTTGVLKHTMSRVYDQLGRVSQTLNAAGHATTFAFDANDNATDITDPVHKTSQAFDALDRVISSTQDANGLAVPTGYQYNALNEVTQVTDPKGLATTYGYNGFGDLITRVSPDTGTTAYGYDTADNRVSQVDAKGITTIYGYDLLNRLSGVTYPTTALNVTYVFDVLNPICEPGESYPKGHLTQITDSSGNTQFCYDRFGNLTRKVQVNGSLSQTTRFEYTMGGELYRVTYPSGAQALYTRNANDKITKVDLTIGGVTSTLVSSVSYTPFGPLNVLTFGNGRALTSSFTLDYNFYLNFDNAAGGLNLSASVDDVGNITALNSTVNGAGTLRNYTYDGLDRLKIATTPGTPSLDENFTYDPTGNRLSKQIGTGVAQAYVYPGTSHQLTSIAGGTARTYDADGSTLTEDGGSGLLTFVYDDRERMTESKIAGTVYRDYKYNGRGERVSRIDPANSANTVNFAYDEAGHLLGDYTSTGTALHEYVWMDDLLVGVIAPSEGSTAKFEYVESDQVGTARVVIDPIRNVAIWRWSVTGSTFGDHLPDADADGNGTSWAFNLRYPGQYYEGGYGLPNYNYLRDYEASTGRYVESDPIGLGGGVSTYSYVRENPLGSTDRSGLWDTDTHTRLLFSALRACHVDDGTIDAIARRSAEWDAATQLPSQAIYHAMRAPGQSPQDAIAATNRYIAGTLGAARYDWGWAHQGTSNFQSYASFFDDFARAQHAITDSTSPAHRDSNGVPYAWPGVPNMLHHGDLPGSQETWAQMTPALLQKNISMIQNAWIQATGSECGCGR